MKLKDIMLRIGDAPSPIPTIIFVGGALFIGVGVIGLLSKYADTPERVEKTKKASEDADDVESDISEYESDKAKKEREREARANNPENAKAVRKGCVDFIKSGVILTAISSLLRKMALNLAFDKFQEVKRAGRKLVRDRMDANDRLKQALYSLERAANDLKKNPDTFDQAVGMQSAYCQIYSAMNPELWRRDK